MRGCRSPRDVSRESRLGKLSSTEHRIFLALLATAPGPGTRFTVDLDTLKAAAAEFDEDTICRALVRLAKEKMAFEQGTRVVSSSLLGAVQIVGETVITEISDLAYQPQVRAEILRPKFDA
jgi:hypothetical protein